MVERNERYHVKSNDDGVDLDYIFELVRTARPIFLYMYPSRWVIPCWTEGEADCCLRYHSHTVSLSESIDFRTQFELAHIFGPTCRSCLVFMCLSFVIAFDWTDRAKIRARDSTYGKNFGNERRLLSAATSTSFFVDSAAFTGVRPCP